MDILRDPPRQRKRYALIGLASAAIAVATVAVGRLEPAASTVDRSTLWIDTVRQGEMVRQVRGQGTLEPEQVLFIAAVTGGRVDQIYVRPGASVTPNTVILQMSNPDVELEALSADQQLGDARSQLANLQTSLETQRLTQENALAAARAEYQAATRVLAATEPLAKRGLASQKELEDARDKAEQSEVAYRTANAQLAVLAKSVDAQIALQRQTVERLGVISAFRHKRVDAMRVKANFDGVLQDMDLQPGQWIQSGTLLAKVAQSGRLKAVLRVPETQAKDLQLGQPASIDTRNGVVRGRVARIDPSSQNGAVAVDVALEGKLPPGARPQLSVDGVIEIERLKHTLYVGRPAYGEAESTTKLFKLSADGKEASRVTVKLGRTSVNVIEVVHGLRAGDRVIVSDMSAADGHDRVRVR